MARRRTHTPSASSLYAADPAHTQRSEEQRSAVVSRVGGACSVLLLSLGAALIWWADLDAVRRHELSHVQRATREWSTHHAQAWRDSKWTLLADGKEVLRLQPAASEFTISERPEYELTSSRFEATDLLGSVFAWSADMTDAADDGGAGGGEPGDEGSSIADERQVTEEMQEPLVLELQVAGPGTVTQRLPLYTGPLVYARETPASSWKTCRFSEHGLWLSRVHACRVWDFVSRVCVQVEFDTKAHKWTRAQRYGGDGCDPIAGWTPVSTGRLPSSYYRQTEEPAISRARERQSGVAVVNAADPALLVANMTGGSMTLAEWSVNEVAFGIVLCVLGMLMALPVVGLQAIAWLAPRDTHNEELKLLTQSPRALMSV